MTTFDGSYQGLRPFTAALLVHLGPLTAWILESAPAHLATLSAGKKKDVKGAEAEFRDAYGDVGVMIARQHILQILIRVFQELQPTAHLMRSEALYEYGRTAATDVWDAIFATYNAKSDFVCNQTMALLKLLQQFDGTNFLGMQADLNSLLTQIAVDKISIRDLAAMCLVVCIKNAGLREPLFRDAYHKIIQTKSTQYLQIMPAKTPDRLLTVLARTQDAFDILEANPNYEPHTARAYFTGALGNVTGVKASGCGGCVQHCIGVKHDDNTKFWRATPTHKPRAGNRAHLAIEGPSDSFSVSQGKTPTGDLSPAAGTLAPPGGPAWGRCRREATNFVFFLFAHLSYVFSSISSLFLFSLLFRLHFSIFFEYCFALVVVFVL